MTPIAAARVLADDQSADYAPWPGSELVHGPGFDVWFGPAYHPDLTVVRHVRLETDTVDEAVLAARRLIRARGRSRALWSVGETASPCGLTERLESIGLRPHSVLKAVVLSREPEDVSAGVVVRRVGNREDFRSSFRIEQSAFETDPDIAVRGEAFLDDAYEAEATAAHVATYIAYLDGDPVATARATFTDIGVVLHGGSTLHRARGRGAYRALAGAMWNGGIERGTPYLTTLARPMSYPILKRMGFEDVGDIRMLVDRF